MPSTPFEAIYNVSLYTDDILIEEFEENIKVRANTTEEAYTMAKSLLYDRLTHKTPELPYENYVVQLKSFEEDTSFEAKTSFIKLSTMFYLSTGLELLLVSICLRHIVIASLLTCLALYFDKTILTYTVFGITVLLGISLTFCYKKLLTKKSYAWLHSIVLVVNLLQILIFWS